MSPVDPRLCSDSLRTKKKVVKATKGGKVKPHVLQMLSHIALDIFLVLHRWVWLLRLPFLPRRPPSLLRQDRARLRAHCVLPHAAFQAVLFLVAVQEPGVVVGRAPRQPWA